MATNTEEIVVKFRTEGGQEVEETFRKAGDAGEQFHQKITKAGSALGDLRLKSEARVANNIGAIAQSFASGGSAADIFATAVTKLSETLRGSLLYAGAAAIGVGLYETIVKTGEAFIKLDDQVQRLRGATKGPDFLKTDEVKKNVQDIEASIGQLQAQIINRSAPVNIFGVPIHVLGTETEAGLNRVDQLRIGQLRQKEIESIDSLTSKQLDLNQVQRDALHLSTLQADIDQAEIERKEELGSLPAPATTDAAGLAAAQRLQDAVNAKYDEREAKDEKQLVLLGQELELQHNIADVQNEMLASADEGLSILDKRISVLQNELNIKGLIEGSDRRTTEAELKSLQAAKQRSEFARQLQRDLAGLELGRVRGGIGSDRARIEAAQTRAQAAAVYGTNSPEFQSAEAGLEDEQFRQFEEYQKDPAAFRQKRINEQHERERFQFLKNTGQLPPDIATNPIADRQAGVVKSIKDLIDVLKGLPQAVGVT